MCFCFTEHELVESEDHVEVNGITFNKPFVEVSILLVCKFIVEAILRRLGSNRSY